MNSGPDNVPQYRVVACASRARYVQLRELRKLNYSASIPMLLNST
jgi:hypothetical protein